jgi:Lipid A 3-O-deacylase (PagL)
MLQRLAAGLLLTAAWTASGFVRGQELIPPPITPPSPPSIAAPPPTTVPPAPPLSDLVVGLPPAPPPWFSIDRGEFVEVLAGAYSCAHIGPRFGKSFDYVPIAIRIGCRPCDGHDWLGDHGSIGFEAIAAPIYREFGSVFGGSSFLARLDLRDRNMALVPYIQGETGFVLNDAYRDLNQRAIGELFEFIQQVEFGVRWNIRGDIALIAEGGLQHISNARLASRNFGVNSLGGSVGIQWGCCAK